MVKLTKRMNMIYKNIDLKKQFSIENAIDQLKNLSKVKFIESVDISINLGIDPKKTEQNIRGNVCLPHGTGKKIKFAIFTSGKEIAEIKKLGIKLVGMEDLAIKITNGEKDFNVVIAKPEAMDIVSKLGPILGPKGLMPNPKLGTITNNITKTIKKIKNGQINFRNDKNGIIHASIGKINFTNYKIKENLHILLKTLKKYKPLKLKGNYIKNIYISSTMGISIKITKDCTNLIN
ncbi:50S ribosomal protein L1 [Enterobacteriaceae endosymbiont of Donacia bicoloricornis]|uniref:50S ribosomal protein L1 n=1 Tax=Enterobacteriaceae endosymbiont of Donacia bicoloricornis TaxID=2675772 RepID=UPI00144A1B73|nr:50S ribosomal protein L1 [Enterobacteriaceae endosymbiont of Donacia bicoloricornis]QJC37833.1 50S ribosomal protein L1 [Enterobacteriaceae endosymbiont of Donacia bicoloricornis]